MPAILLMPFVAAVGYGANDVLFTIIFGALNGVLFYALLIALRKADTVCERHQTTIGSSSVLPLGPHTCGAASGPGLVHSLLLV